MEATFQDVAAVCLPALSMVCLGIAFQHWLRAVRGDEVEPVDSVMQTFVRWGAWIALALALYGYFATMTTLCIASGVSAAVLFVTSFTLAVGIPEKIETQRLAKRATDEALRKVRNLDE